jgi:hypothetical protein
MCCVAVVANAQSGHTSIQPLKGARQDESCTIQKNLNRHDAKSAERKEKGMRYELKDKS